MQFSEKGITVQVEVMMEHCMDSTPILIQDWYMVWLVYMYLATCRYLIHAGDNKADSKKYHILLYADWSTIRQSYVFTIKQIKGV